jgi:TetR/AcrR family transcriptional regulator, cholesterol catabolism regulator
VGLPVSTTRESPPSVPRGAERRRNEIVSCAARLFDEFGYANTSMQQIADATRMAKPTLYHYFPGKDAILFQVHEEFIDILIGQFRARAAVEQGIRGRLVGMMRDILTLMDTHRGHVRVFFEHHRELPPARQALIRAKRDEYEGLLVALLEDGRARGELALDGARLTALGIFGMCNWAYQWYSTDGAMEPAEIAERFGSVVLDGILMGPA